MKTGDPVFFYLMGPIKRKLGIEKIIQMSILDT